MSDGYETHELELAFQAGAASRDAEVQRLQMALAGTEALEIGTAERCDQLREQERRLLWLIERAATVDSFQGKYRVATQNETLSEWHDDPLEAIDEAIAATELKE